MQEVRTGFIDPKDYPFRHLIEEQKHLDTDELRHTIKRSICNVSLEVGKEHLYCDKEQLNAEGKFRRPKKLQDAERRGFKNVMDMDNADKKAEEDKKVKEHEDMKIRSQIMERHARDLEDQLLQSRKDLEDYKALTEDRFNTIAVILQDLQKNNKK